MQSPSNTSLSPSRKRNSISSSQRKGSAGNIEEEKSPSIRAKEVKYNLQEWILIKAFTFSMVTVIICSVLALFILDLVGDYFPIVALSVLTSIALRPTKDSIANRLKKYLGIIPDREKKGSYFDRSLIKSIISNLKDLLRIHKDPALFQKKKATVSHYSKTFDLTADIYAILTICIVYILISRFGIIVILYVSVVCVLVDLLARLAFDLTIYVIDNIRFLKKTKLAIQKSKMLSEGIDSYVGTFVIAGSIFLSVLFIIFIIVMLIRDADSILTNLQQATGKSIKIINSLVSSKFGVENAIDENFAANFLKNYNESIYSYLPNDDIKNIYLSLSETIGTNSAFKEHGDSTFKTLIKGLINQNQTSPHVEFEQCLEKNKINMDWHFLRNLEYVYCGVLHSGKKFSIDPYEALDKARGTFGVLFRFFFGTILTQLFLISKSAINYFINTIFFFVCLYYLLETKESIITNATNLLPFDEATKQEVQDFAIRNIKGSFLCTIKIFIYHFVLTWLLFDILNLELGFILATLAGLCSIIPLIPPYVLCIPHSIYIYFAREDVLLAILLPIVYMLISNKAYLDIYEKTINIHPYVTGLSIVMGIYAFNIQGIIYGPLLMCLALIIYNVIKKQGTTTSEFLRKNTTGALIQELENLEKSKSSRKLI